MRYFRAFIGVLILFVIACFGYFVSSAQESGDISLVESYFENGELDKAEHTLYGLKEKLPFPEYHLYLSYIQRAKGLREDSDRSLQTILSRPYEGISTTLIQEVYLNKALNAYLQGNSKKMFEALKMVQNSSEEKNGWVEFFTALIEYQEGRYDEALKIWKESSSRFMFSPMMSINFSEVFSPHWMVTRLSRAQIEVDNYQEARKELGAELGLLKEDEKDEINFLLALSYLKEAEGKEVSVATPYYRLAFKSLKKVPDDYPPYIRIRQKLVDEIYQEASGLIQEGNWVHLPFYVTLLEEWQAQTELEHLRQLMNAGIRQKIDLQDWDSVRVYTKIFNRVFPEENLHKELETLSEKLLVEGDFGNFRKIWRLTELNVGEPELLQKRFSRKISILIPHAIETDRVTLMNTREYLALFKEIESEKEKQNDLVQQLIIKASGLWKSGEMEKSVNLLKLAQMFESENLDETIEGMIRRFYSQALKEDKIDQLEFVLLAVNELGLKSVPIYDSNELKGQLEEAEFLYTNNRYDAATVRAKWVLKLDPKNSLALKIVGMSAYRNGLYEDALKTFKQFKVENPQVVSAYAVAEILAGDQAKGEQILSKNRIILPETYLRLGFGSLMNNDPEYAEKWFDLVEGNEDEVNAGKYYAKFALKKWDEVIGYGKKLSPSYIALDSFQGIMVKALSAQEKIYEAEQKLNELLNSPLDKSSANFPVYFQKKFTEMSRNLVAAQYYRDVKQDNNQALHYFNKINNPSPVEALEKAELLVETGQFHEARMGLLKVIEDSRSTDKSRSSPLLAKIYSELGRYAEAIPFYKEYFLLNPNKIEFRGDYALALTKVRRFDLALEQLILLQNERELNDEENVNYVNCLIHTDQFNKANEWARKWFSKGSSNLVFQLKMAQNLLVTKNIDLIKGVLHRVSQKEALSLEENSELLNLWIGLGNFGKAQVLVERERKNLEKTIQGLTILAHYYHYLRVNEKAFEYAERALRIDPDDIQLAEFIEEVDSGQENIIRMLKKHDRRIEEEKKSVTMQLIYASDLIEIAIENYALKKTESVDESYDLQKAVAILSTMAEKYPDLPEIYFHLGKGRFLLDDDHGAHNALMKAISMDVSYVQVYQLLALLYEEYRDFQNSKQALVLAVKYAPNDPDIWLQLAELSESLDNKNDAIIAYENVIKFFPNDPENYIKLAALQLQIKSPEEALVNLDKALKLSPGNKETLKLLLITLYDSNFQVDSKNLPSLTLRQASTYKVLHAIDPQEAERILSEAERRN